MPDLMRSGGWSPAVLEQWYRDHLAAARYDLSQSGLPATTLDDLLSRSGLDPSDLLQTRLDDGDTFGSGAVRAAVAKRWGAETSDGVMMTHGSSEAIFLVVSSLLQSGDRVVSLTPSYHSWRSTILAGGAELIEVPLWNGSDFAFDAQRVLDAIDSRVALVVLNLPHNPTGVTATADEQAALIAKSAKVGAFLLWDDAFGDVVWDGERLPCAARLYERAIVVGTLSKAFRLPGLRVGWCIAAPEVLRSMVGLKDASTLFLSPLIERLAHLAIGAADGLLKSGLEHARANRTALGKVLASVGVVDGSLPAGGFTCFPRLIGIDDAIEFCTALLAEREVLLVPGIAFGNWPAHIRLSVAPPADHFRQGLAAIIELQTSRSKGNRPPPPA